MKKIITIICLMTFIGIQAQDIQGGLKLSVNLPMFSGDVDNTKGKVGYSIGYFESMMLTNNIALEGEINYTHVAYQLGQGDDFTFEDDINFFEIPLMVKYVSNDFHIGGGFQYCLGSVTDFGPIVDLTYYNDNLRFGARAFLGSDKSLTGNSMTNISAYIGIVIF